MNKDNPELKDTIIDTTYDIAIESIRKREIYLAGLVESTITAGTHRLLLKKIIENWITSYGQSDEIKKIASLIIGRFGGRVTAKMILGSDGAYSDIAKKELIQSLGIYAIRYFMDHYTN